VCPDDGVRGGVRNVLSYSCSIHGRHCGLYNVTEASLGFGEGGARMAVGDGNDLYLSQILLEVGYERILFLSLHGNLLIATEVSAEIHLRDDEVAALAVKGDRVR